MCGICGIYSFSGIGEISKESLLKMNNALAHRGPDGSGTYHDKEIALGHRRLSIIDLDNGQQPMTNEDKSVCVVFNGEIYNYKVLRQKLLKKGYKFRTESDTEAIVHAWQEYGKDCVDYLEGMFAFAVWDCKTRKLLLVRDRLGIKPLYYTHVKDQFLFASEIKALLAHPQVKVEVNISSVPVYLFSTSIVNGNTMFKNIYSLEAGNRMTIVKDSFNIDQYWDLKPNSIKHEADSFEVCKQNIYKMLVHSVEQHTVSDVPIASLLSGGVDSSLVSALAAEYVNGPLMTYTMEYKRNAGIYEKESDIYYARMLADEYEFNYNELIFDANDYQDCFDKATWQVEKPIEFTTPSSYLLYQSVSKKNKVVLTGEGADELFGGYYFFLNEAKSGEITEYPWAPYYHEVSAIINPDLEKQTGYPEVINSNLQGMLARFDSDDYLNKVLYLFIKIYLQEMLERQDKTSMASGVEARVPFLDHHLVEYVINLPSQYKFGYQDEKYLLRESMRNIIHKAILNRKKKPFPFPVDAATMYQQIKKANNLVQSKTSPVSYYFLQQETQNFFSRSNQFKALDSLALFRTSHAIIALDTWHKSYGI